jgi:hypothetical protein
MVMRSESDEREYVLQEAMRAVRKIRVWPGMRLRVPIHNDLTDYDDPFDAVLSTSPDDGDDEPLMVRVATVELPNLDDPSTWVITLPPPPRPRGLKRALEQAEGAGLW